MSMENLSLIVMDPLFPSLQGGIPMQIPPKIPMQIPNLGLMIVFMLDIVVLNVGIAGHAQIFLILGQFVNMENKFHEQT